MGEVELPQTRIDPWCQLQTRLVNELNANKLWFDEARTLSRAQLGVAYNLVKDAESFFEVLHSRFEESDLLEYLTNLFSHMQYHMDFESVADQIKECKRLKDVAKEDCLRRGIWTDENFVGRNKEIKQTIDVLLHQKYQGVSLCGLGGMGKTSTANQICLLLFKLNPPWIPRKIELREQKSVMNFLQATIAQIEDDGYVGQTVDENGERTAWTIQNEMDNVIKRISKIQRPTVLLFDNVDDILNSEIEKMRLIGFFKKLFNQLNLLNSPCKVLITARQKLLSLEGCSEFLDALHEIELKQLNMKEAKDLFSRCTSTVQSGKSPMQYSESDVEKMLDLCGHCPLAIRSVCSILRRGDMTLKNLILSLENSSHSIEAMSMNCLRQSFERLSENYKQALICLNLFSSGKFSLVDASAVLTAVSGDEKPNRYSTALDLVYLKSQHLLELSEEFSHANQNEGGKYFLHSLVHKALDELQQEPESRHTTLLNVGKEKFIEHYYGIALKTMDNVKKDPKVLLTMVDDLPHLRKFYEYVKILPSSLRQRNYSSRREASTTISKLADLSAQICEGKARRTLYEILASHAQNQNEIIEVLRWKTQIAKYFLDVDEIDDNQQIIDELEDLCKRHSDEFESDSSMRPVYAYYLLQRGRIENKRAQLTKAKESIAKAIKTFGKSKNTWYKSDIANAYNTLGCIHFKQGEYEESRKYHECALSKAENEDLNKATFLLNIGVCYFSLCQEVEDDHLVMQYTKNADEFFSNALALSHTDNIAKAKILINRSKLYRLDHVNRYREGWDDVEDAVRILERVLSPPHESLTIAYHEKGEFLRRWTRQHYRSQDKLMTRKRYEDAVVCYSKVMEQLKLGGLTATHSRYKDIKANHVFFLKKLQRSDEVEEVDRFYTTFAVGKYKKRSRNESRDLDIGQQTTSSESESTDMDDKGSVKSSSASSSSGFDSSYDDRNMSINEMVEVEEERMKSVVNDSMLAPHLSENSGSNEMEIATCDGEGTGSHTSGLPPISHSKELNSLKRKTSNSQDHKNSFSKKKRETDIAKEIDS